MGSIHIGGVELLEPDAKLRALHLNLMERQLMEMGFSGTSTNPVEINRIVQALFGALNATFSDFIGAISSRSLSDFFLFQYEQMMKVRALYKEGLLSIADTAIFERIAPSRVIALRFIVERIVLLGETDDDSIPHEVKKFAAHRVFTCAEELVNMYILSDQTLRAFPEHTRLTVAHGAPQFLSLKLDALDPLFGERVRAVQITNAEKSRIEELLEGRDIVGDSDARRRHLDPVLKEIVGADLDTIFQVMRLFCAPFIPPEGEKYPIPFLMEEMVLNGIAEKMKLSREVVNRIVEAFMLTREKMETEKHEVWISDNEYRSFSRPLLRLLHVKGWHITFSPLMVSESIDHFLNMLAFNQAPAEWMAPSLKVALTRLHNELSVAFESRYAALMQQRDFVGRRFSGVVGTGVARIRIPGDVGEIDYLGYCQRLNLLVVTECKLTRWGSNPKDYYNDRRDFVDDKKSYVKQVTRKAEWVQGNLQAVFDAMKSVLPIPADAPLPSRVAHCIVTYYPTPASLFVRSCPCTSFAKFFDALDAANAWPYESGVKEVEQPATRLSYD